MPTGGYIQPQVLCYYHGTDYSSVMFMTGSTAEAPIKSRKLIFAVLQSLTPVQTRPAASAVNSNILLFVEECDYM